MIRLRIERTGQTPLANKASTEKSRKKVRDPRITVSRFSWLELLGMWLAVMVIGTGMVLIIGEFAPGFVFTWEGTLAGIGYCALMAFLVSIFTMIGRRTVYDRPINQLGEAARRVAEGDFSLRLPELRRDGKKGQMDVMYEDFNTMVKELSTIETLKDDFVGAVSHEIKTPLATIQNYAFALQKKELSDEERAEYIEAIVGASARLSMLVSNILRLNKLENQGIVSDTEPYDLSEQLRKCMLDHEKAWEEKGLTIEVDIDELCVVSHDASLLESVWNNLISNAIKFTDPGGTIRISQGIKGSLVYVEIADTGCGMDELTQRRIFDKFYQGDTSHAQEGNGLGLALVSRALKLSGGEITVSSTPGTGSTFIVWLKL